MVRQGQGGGGWRSLPVTCDPRDTGDLNDPHGTAVAAGPGAEEVDEEEGYGDGHRGGEVGEAGVQHRQPAGEEDGQWQAAAGPRHEWRQPSTQGANEGSFVTCVGS